MIAYQSARTALASSTVLTHSQPSGAGRISSSQTFTLLGLNCSATPSTQHVPDDLERDSYTEYLEEGECRLTEDGVEAAEVPGEPNNHGPECNAQTEEQESYEDDADDTDAD